MRFVLGLLLIASHVQAKTVLKKTVTAPDESAPTVEIEMRPSYTAADNHFFSSNYAEAGYKFSNQFWLGYQQQFTIEKNSAALFDGYVRAKINKLWVDPDNTAVYLSLEPRLYLPTDATKAAAGMVGTVLPYVKVTGEMSAAFSFTLKDAPGYHLYTRDGAYASGKAKANPSFENWLVLSMDYAPPQGLVNFSLPIYFISTRYRDFDARAAHNGDWGHQFVLYPELTFVLQKHLFVGAAYESDDLAKLQDDTANSGTWHVFLRTSF